MAMNQDQGVTLKK